MAQMRGSVIRRQGSDVSIRSDTNGGTYIGQTGDPLVVGGSRVTFDGDAASGRATNIAHVMDLSPKADRVLAELLEIARLPQDEAIARVQAMLDASDGQGSGAGGRMLKDDLLSLI